MNVKKISLKLVALAIITFMFGFGIATGLDRSTISEQQQMLATIGKLSLTQSQLINAVEKAQLTVYWAGPLAGYSYSLSTDNAGSTVVRYLATKADLNATTNSARMIATYVSDNAFSQSQSVAAKKGNTSFVNADKSLVFYRSTNPNDIFLSFPKKNVQVEIYDPHAGQALSLAVLAGQITRIGA